MSRTVGNIFLLTGLKVAGLLLSVVLIMLQTAVLGTGPLADAYFLVRRLILSAINMTSEATNQLLVPDFARTSAALGPVRARQALTRSGLLLVAVSVAIAGILAIFAPQVVALLAPGFDPERADMAVLLLRIVVICLPLAMIGGVAGAFNFSRRRFGITTLARMAPRLALVGVLLAMGAAAGPVALSWALVAGVAISTAVVVWKSLREAARPDEDRGEDPSPVPAADLASETETELAMGASPERADIVTAPLAAQPHSKRQTRARAVAIAINVVAQMAMGWLDAGLASLAGVGAVTVLFVAQRLLSSAPGAVNSSVTAVFYTEYSHSALATAAPRAARNMQVAAAVRISLFMVLPLAFFIVIVANPLVQVLLERGAFTAADTAATAQMIRYLSPLLLINAVLAAFLAATLADAKLPLVRIFLWFSAATLGLRLLLGLGLVQIWGLAGLSVAIIASSVAGAMVLGRALSRHHGRVFLPEDLRALTIMLGAAALAAGAALAVVDLLALDGVAGLVMAGAVVLGLFVLLCAVARLPELLTLKRIVTRWRNKRRA